MRVQRGADALAANDAAATGPRVGALERLPKWLNLIPIVLQWLGLALRYRSITLPSAANPAITTGGMVGEGKMEYFACMGPLALAATAATASFVADSEHSLRDAERLMHDLGVSYPVIVKPDLGWCGFGVRLVADRAAMSAYLGVFPRGERIVLQRWIDAPGEAGLFYMRRPAAAAGEVIGLLLRHFPRVTGDGVRSIEELIAADPRASRLGRDRYSELPADRHRIPAAGEVVRVAQVGSTRVGGSYEDGSPLMTAELDAVVDAIARDMTAFHAGRFDVKYTSLAALRAGRFTIIEVNGAGSEAVHAWDPAFSLAQAYRIIFDKQRRLFAIGDAMRRQGHRPAGCMALLRHHLRQQSLINRYPPSN